MGRPIVYCEGCGINLREDDFQRGKAVEVDRRPWCSACRPPSTTSATPVPRRRSTDRIPVARPASRSSSPRVPPPSTRRTPPTSDKRRLWIIVGVVAAIVLLGVIVAAASSRRRSARIAGIERTAVAAVPR